MSDSYGVYQWFNDETIKIYFGPQQGRSLQVQLGKLDVSGLYVNDYDPPGPCVMTMTSISRIMSIDELRQSGENILDGGDGGDGSDDNSGDDGCKLFVHTMWFASIILISFKLFG